MRKKSHFFLLLLFLSTPLVGWGSPPNKIEIAWFECKQTNDCTLTQDPCEHPTAVNKRSESQLKTFWEEARKNWGPCLPKDEQLKLVESRLSAQCQNKICLVKAPSLPRPQSPKSKKQN